MGFQMDSWAIGQKKKSSNQIRKKWSAKPWYYLITFDAGQFVAGRTRNIIKSCDKVVGKQHFL